MRLFRVGDRYYTSFWFAVLMFVFACMIGVYALTMAGASVFIHWMLSYVGYWTIIPFGAVCMMIGIWLEKREQKRLGVKRPLFRWNND